MDDGGVYREVVKIFMTVYDAVSEAVSADVLVGPRSPRNPAHIVWDAVVDEVGP